MGEEKRELLPGPTVYEWDRIESAVGVVGWCLIALMIPFGVAASQRVSWALPVAVALLALGFLSIAFSNYGWSPATQKDRDELALGYTTLPFPHRPEVDLVEPKHGVIIRKAGAPLLTMQEYKSLKASTAHPPDAERTS